MTTTTTTTTSAGFDRLPVIDLETTGLKPATEQILEVGVVVVDTALREVAARCVLLTTESTRSWAERTARRAAEGAELEIPERMHLDNGLVADLLDPARFLLAEAPNTVADTLQAASDILCAFLDEQEILGRMPLTGSSVRSLDGPFLEAHMPELFKRFTHRTIDASALTEYARFVDPGGEASIMASVPASGHRTIGDCQRSIEILRSFGIRYRIGPSAPAAS